MQTSGLKPWASPFDFVTDSRTTFDSEFFFTNIRDVFRPSSCYNGAGPLYILGPGVGGDIETMNIRSRPGQPCELNEMWSHTQRN